MNLILEHSLVLMLSVASLNPTVLYDEFACWWPQCGVTWDAVPKQ